MLETGKQSALVGYIAKEKFGPQNGKSWTIYLDGSKLGHLSEVISMDGMLCPTIVKTLVDEDWNHNIHEDFRTNLFWDLDYLINRVAAAVENLNILAVISEPDSDGRSLFHDHRFEFVGYDLIDPETGVSALTNCGGFDEAFRSTDLNFYGLLPDFEQSKKVKELLIERYPNEAHAHCVDWAIWRMNDIPR